MINGRSVVGLRVSDVVTILRQSASPVHFVIATKVRIITSLTPNDREVPL